MRNGFSLVELSIVLVIIGLLVGGILAGQSLIRAAELRSVSTDAGRYITAVHTFRDKYFALPGDMTNATSFWTAQHATPANCRGTSSSTQATCNGNGDNWIWDSPGSEEHFRSWQHLANAGLVEGTYTGVGGTTGLTDWDYGTNSPRSRINNAGFALFDYDNSAGTKPTWPSVVLWHALWFAGDDNNDMPDGTAITPAEAWNIDSKMDDGKTLSGKVLAGQLPICNSSGDYPLTTTSKACFLIFKY